MPGVYASLNCLGKCIAFENSGIAEYRTGAVEDGLRYHIWRVSPACLLLVPRANDGTTGSKGW